METDFVWIVRGVVYITESRRRQVFLSVFSGLSSTVFSFIYQDNLLKRTMALWSPKRRENCACICLIPQMITSKLCAMFNKPLQQKYGSQRKLNYRYTSFPSVFSLAKKHRNCGHVTGRSCVEYSVWRQSRGVVWGQLLLFLTFSYKGNI